MPQTQLGKTIAGWSATAKEEFKSDLNTLATIPLDTLRPVINKIAKTYPSCNVLELSALEAEQRAFPEPQDLQDATSVWAYIWENIDGESPEALTADLLSLALLTESAARTLKELLTENEPYREAANITAKYLRVGAPLFVGLRGTVDIRCRFHRTDEDFVNAKTPTELVDAQQVIMVNLTIHHPDDEETIVSFLMDENDLGYMKRFARNMEKELELSKSLLKSEGSTRNA